MNEILKPFEASMTKTLDFLKEEYANIRAGRANPHLLDKIRVDYYGTQTNLQGVANVSVPEARVIMIQPWESKMIKEIEKQILASDIGITPSNDGKVIRLTFPELTEDRRKELAKDVKKKGEAAKVAIRNIRRDANDAIKKAGKEISEDETKKMETDAQKMTDKFIETIDKTVEEKTKEIMTVQSRFGGQTGEGFYGLTAKGRHRRPFPMMLWRVRFDCALAGLRRVTRAHGYCLKGHFG